MSLVPRLRPTILAVDDEPGVREVFRLALEDAYDVVEAADGQSALDIVRSRRVDVALLDVRMPGMDGLTLLARFRELARDVKVIVVTAVDAAETAVAAMKLGAVDYLTKPVSLDTLLSMIGSILTTARPALEPAVSAAPGRRRLLVVGSDIGTRATLAAFLGVRDDLALSTLAWKNVYAAAKSAAELVVVEIPRLDETTFRLVRHLHRRLPEAAWVLIAPRGRADAVYEALTGRVRAVLRKPLGLAELLSEIAAILPPPRPARSPVSALSLRVLETARVSYGTASIASLSRAVGLPGARVSRLFRDDTSLTVKQYLTRLRVEAVKCLLVETDNKLDVIAGRVGLWDASHLSRVFREHTGRTPGRYRKIQKHVGFVQ